jgi:hypothetical protein
MKMYKHTLRHARRRSAIFGAVSLVAIGPALASTYTGSILQVQIEASSSGGTRVSIQVSGTTSCVNPSWHASWYAFEYSGDNGPGKAWLAALLAAKTSGQPIDLHGTGTCDQYGIELLSYTNSI